MNLFSERSERKSKGKYPKIIVPKELKKIQLSVPNDMDIGPFPREPLKPEYPETPKLQNLAEPKLNKKENGCFGLIAIIGILGLIIWGDTWSDSFSSILLIVIIGIGFKILGNIYHNIEIKERYLEEKRNYPQRLDRARKNFNEELKEYRLECARIDDEYVESLKKYENETIPKYLYKVNLVEDYISKLYDSKEVVNLRVHILKQNSKNVAKPFKVLSYEKSYKHKKVDERIGQELRNSEFSKWVFDDLAIKEENSNKKFIMDYSIYEENYGIAINIEIDEPYNLKNGEPLNCAESLKEAMRESTFIRNGWIVIRFAEEQAVRWPKESVSYIFSIIYSLIFYRDSYDLGKLPLVDDWTETEAHKLAYSRHRNKYLNF